MSAITDITVKKADGTTNITFTKVSPSAGDGNAALLRSNTVGGAAAARPSFTVTPSGKPGRRIVKTNAVFPIIDPVSLKVVDYITMKCESNVPDTAPDGEVAEAVVQSSNLNASAVITTARRDGYAT